MLSKITILIASSLLFIGCGGGGSGFEDFNNSFSENNTISESLENDFEPTSSLEENNTVKKAPIQYSYKNSIKEKDLEYEVNELRAISGLNTLSVSEALSFAMNKHKIYCVKNKSYSHYEEKDKPFFFGEDPNERANKVMPEAQLVGEVFLVGKNTQVVDIMMNTLYHRSLMLDCDFNKNGIVYDKENRFFALLFDGKYNKECPHHWVYPKKEHTVYSYYWNKEIPRPIYEEYAGYPVSIYFQDSVEKVSFELFDENNESVETTDIIYKSFSMLAKREFHLFPKNALNVGETYQAVFKYKENDEVKTIQWSFDVDKDGDLLYH